LAAEQHITRHPEPLGLGVEQGVFDRTEPLTDHAPGCRPGKAVELGIDPLVVEDVLRDDPRGEPLNDRADPGRTEAFVELAPADDALVGGELQKMVIPPARVTAQDFETRDLHRRSPVTRRCRSSIAIPGLRRIRRTPSTSPSRRPFSFRCRRAFLRVFSVKSLSKFRYQGVIEASFLRGKYLIFRISRSSVGLRCDFFRRRQRNLSWAHR